VFDWDPSKWIILALHRLGLVTGLRCAQEEDIQMAKAFMDHKHGPVAHALTTHEEWKDIVWDKSQLEDYIQSPQKGCIILLDGYVLDVTGYMKEHVGLSILR
jgi:stearoyl-CoA desaturase (Delta-9 desaturase)